MKWIVEYRNSFDQIKKALDEALVLINPNYSKDFLIFSFPSFDTLPTILLQKNVEGLEQPITFFIKALRDVEIKHDMMEIQAYTLVKYLKAFKIYVLHSKFIAYVPSASMKDIFIQPDIDGRRSKCIAQILEFDLEIKPTKLVKGQGLAKVLAKSNCKDLMVNYVNICSENQQVELSYTDPQVIPPLA
jgi:hypothetical protein